MAIFMMCMPIGVALGLFAGGALLNATHDWRTAFLIFGIPGIILAIIVLFLPDYKTERRQGEGVLSKAYFKRWGVLFKVKSYWLFVISTTFLYFLIFATQAWVPTLIMRSYDMDRLSEAQPWGAIGLLNLIAPFGGFIADRWQVHNKVGRPLFLIVATFLCAVSMPGFYFYRRKDTIPNMAACLYSSGAAIGIYGSRHECTGARCDTGTGARCCGRHNADSGATGGRRAGAHLCGHRIGCYGWWGTGRNKWAILDHTRGRTVYNN